jgi:hypothetical protein
MATPLDSILEFDAEASYEQETSVKRRKAASRQDVILQNITPGHHCVVDKSNGIDLYFEPFGVIDLTWFDPQKLRRSTPLQKSLIDGYLVPITRDEHDSILHAESLRLKEDALNSVNGNKNRRTRKFEVEGPDGQMRELEAEVVNLNKVDSASAQASISSAGQANDPTSFSIAFNRARKEYAVQGMNLTAQVFHKMAQENPSLIKTYLRKEQSDAPLANTVFSGDKRKEGRFFVAGQPGQVDQFGRPLNIATPSPMTHGQLKNFGQDALSAQQELYRTAASVDDSFDPDDDSMDDEPPMAQVIDLNAPDDSDDLSGFGGGGSGVRRL